MSYNPYYQQPYNPPMPDNLQMYRQQYQQPQYQQPQYQQPQQYQNTGMIGVPDENVARNYPVGPNCSVTMRNENIPEIYIKKADSAGCTEFEIYIKKVEKMEADPDNRFVTYKELKALLEKKEASENV